MTESSDTGPIGTNNNNTTQPKRSLPNGNTDFLKSSKSPTLRVRKYSHPVSLQTVKSTLEVPGPAALTKRRLSHVSEAVSRRLSTSIVGGWRSVPVDQVVEQSKSLCSQYIRARLRKCGALNKKLGLRRLRSVLNMNVTCDTCDVFAQLNYMGRELESRFPKLYYSVCGQVCFTLSSEKVVHQLFTSVAQEVVREGEMSWGRVVAIFAVAGALACDCVRQGHVNYVVCLIESLGLFVESDVASWIIQQGGWGTLTTHFAPKSKYSAASEVTAVVMVLFFVFWSLRWLYCTVTQWFWIAS